MNLLLTSGGLRNEELRKVFIDMLQKPVDQVRVAVIPTASKSEAEQAYVKKDLADLLKTGIEQIDTVDISELNREEWLPKLESADVIFVVGGDVYFLRDWVVKSGLEDELPKLLQTKVYVGISAGSRLLNPDISVAALHYDPKKDPDGMHLVDFCIVPHMNSKVFTDRTPEQIAPKLESFPHTTYLLDDDSAVLVQGSMMQFVGGGKHVEFRK